MSFRFDFSAPLDAETSRIAIDQLDKAIAELADPEGDRHEAIHDVRKRFKKLRALVRLVRPADEDLYRAMNTLWRDAARDLSGLRDRAALIESLDALETHYADSIVSDGFAPVRATLAARRDAVAAAEGDMGDRIEATLDVLRASRARFEDLRFPAASRPAKAGAALAAGYARTHRAARTALAAAEASRAADDFHLLRKHAKYHAAHLQLLGALWPEGLKPARDLAAEIGDDLGRDHDYAVFRQEALAEPDAFGGTARLAAVLALMDRRQGELRERSLDSARRIFAEKPRAAAARLQALHRHARRRGALAAPDLESAEETPLRAAAAA